MNTIQEKTIGEIAAESPASITVFERFGIDYCCGGRRPLADACRDAGITVGEFESALNAAPAAPELDLDWTTRPLTDLHAYIAGRYHAHAREQLATLGTLSTKVKLVHGERHPEVLRVASLVTALEQDMLPHMTKEEIMLFPYVDSLETGAPKECCFGTVANPIRVMMADHEAVGEILRDLRTVTNDYAPPADACFSYRELYRRLAEMERETHEHIHLENNVFFPRALELERSMQPVY